MSKRLLRDDLIVVPAARDGETNLVRDPVSGEEYQFGDPEYFLIESLRKPYSESVLLARLRARFKVERSESELHEFLDLLAEHGLLRDAEEVQATPDEPADRSGRPTQGWHLFDPGRLFAWLAAALHPLRFLIKLLPVFVLIAFFGIWFNASWLAEDFWSIRAEFGLLGRLIFAGFTVNLATQVFQGIVARHYDVPVPSFGLALAFGIIPRFRTIIAPGPGLARGARMWITATSILTRLGLFSLGSIMWLMTRASGTLLPDTAAMLAMLSALSLLFVANPLMNGDGYRLLAAYLEMPNLRQRANSALKGLFRKRPEAIERHAKDTIALRAYALASILFITLLLSLIAFIVSRRLETSFRGAGVALFLLIVVYLVLHFRRQASAARNAQAGPKGAALGTRAAPRRSVEDKASAGTAPRRVTSGKQSETTSGSARFLRYLLLAVLIGVLFLPYQYETGGEAEILPMLSSQIYAEAPGIVDQVAFNGGEWVEKGEMIAQMAKHRQTKDLLATESAIKVQAANIARLETTPSQEELDLATQQLATSRLKHKYSSRRAARLEKLYKTGSISFDSYDEALEEMEIDRQKVAENEANLAAIKEQVNPHELESARAEKQRLQEELAYFEEELHRTALRMPIDGRIITMSLQSLKNKYLENGDLFAEVEDARQVRAKVSIPEADIGEVSVGDKVRLKLWAYPNRTFITQVTDIYPATSLTEYGTVIGVEGVLDNRERLLRSGMTGHAKVEGREMFVIQAFTRALVRFVLIEVWSWLP